MQLIPIFIKYELEIGNIIEDHIKDYIFLLYNVYWNKFFLDL